MGVSRKALMRYRIIDQALTSTSHPYPNLQDLIESVNEEMNEIFDGEGVSRRTIQADLYEMRFSEELNYYAPIEYSNTHRGYYYEDEDFSISKFPLKKEERAEIEFVAHFLSRYEGVPMFHNFKQITQRIFDALNVHSAIEQDQRMLDAIQFDPQPAAKGNEWLPLISEGLLRYRKLKLTYLPFYKGQAEERLVHPYALREYKGRWYLIGISEKSGDMRTYALDRVETLEVLSESFPLNTDFNMRDYFKYSYGIYTFEDEQPEMVRLKFNHLQGRYVKTQPLHQSQKIVDESPESLVVELEVYLSEDLLIDLMSYGDRVKVLSPERLKNELRERHRKAADGNV